MKQLVVMAFFSFSIISCGQRFSKKGMPLKECIVLNDEGVKYLMRPSINGGGEADTAISFFQQAIHCDSNYLIAYINLANAYKNKRDFESELRVYNKLLILSNNYPTFLVQKGILFENTNNIDSAKKIYLLASKLYNDELKKSPNNIEAIKGLVYIKALTVGKDAAINELNKQIIVHADLTKKLNSELYFYENFDRKAITGRALY